MFLLYFSSIIISVNIAAVTVYACHHRQICDSGGKKEIIRIFSTSEP